MQRKIAIFSRALKRNGATKSLVELLKRVDYAKCSVDLYVLDFSEQAQWVEEIPRQVKVKGVPHYTPSFATFFEILRHPVHFIKSVYAGVKLKTDLSMVASMKFTAWRLPKVSMEYDIAISYRHFDVDIFYVCNNIKAKKKFFWVHGVQELDKEEVGELKGAYAKYDGVFPVSNAAQDNLLKFFPQLKSQCTVAYCIVDENEIIDRSRTGERFTPDSDESKVKILTVGRLAEEKGVNLALQACEILVRERYNVTWYAVGDGPKREEMREYISSHGLEENFILLGAMDNPYGMLATCDIYVQPSYLESYGLTINEAKIFHKPIVCTDIPAAREQITSEVTGILVSKNAEEIAKAIARYIDDPNLMGRIIGNLGHEDMNHFEALDIFNSFMVER